MLVLTRKIGDSILIGDSVKVQIVHVKGCQVRVGIEAPKEVQIVREEISTQREQTPVTLKKTDSNEAASRI